MLSKIHFHLVYEIIKGFKDPNILKGHNMLTRHVVTLPLSLIKYKIRYPLLPFYIYFLQQFTLRYIKKKY